VAEVLIRTGFVLEGLQSLLAETRRFSGEVAAELNKGSSQVREGAKGIQYYVDAAGRAREANGRFVSSAELAAAGIKDVGELARYAGRGLDVMDAAVAGVAASLTNTLTNAIGAAAAGLKNMVGDFLQLDGEIRKAAARSGEQGAYDRLARVIDQVGIEAAGTTQEVAAMATSLVSAGMSVSQVEKALPAIVRGAEATGTTFERMGEIVGATLVSFGLKAEDSARVVDALVQGANSSATSVSGMGMAFKYAAPIAKQLGLSVEDLTVAIGLMTNAGITAEMTGVTLRNGLTKLAGAAPTAGSGMRELSGQSAIAAKAIKSLRLDIYQADGTLKPMGETLLKLKAAFDKLAPSARIRLASDMFGGEDDGAKWLSLLGQSEEQIKRMINTMANTKGATDTARKAMEGLGLELQRLTGTLGSLATGMGGVLAAALRPFVAVLNAVAGAAAGLPTPVKTTVSALLALYSAAVLANVGALALGRTLMFVTGAETARAAWVALSATLAGPVVGAIRAVTGALAVQAAATAGAGGAIALLLPGLLAMVAAIGAATAGWAAFNALTNDGKAEIADTKQQVTRLKQEISRKAELGLDTTAAKMKLVNLEKQLSDLEKKYKKGSLLGQFQNNNRFQLDTEAEAMALGRGAGVFSLFGFRTAGSGQIVAQLRNLQKEYGLTSKQARALYYDALAISNIKDPNKASDSQILKAMERLPDLADEWTRKWTEKMRDASKEGAQVPKVTIDSLKKSLQEAQAAVGTVDVSDRMGLERAQDKVKRLQKQIAEAEMTEAERRQRSYELMFNLAKQEVDIAKEGLAIENRRNGVMQARLQAQQQLLDAIANRAQAQEALTRSEFDLVRARGGYQLQQLEKELQVMKDRGAGADQIAAKERQIRDAKAQQQQLEVRSLAAAMEAAAMRFQTERQVLNLKQAGQLIDARSAVTSARSGALEAEQKLLELRQQRAALLVKDGVTSAEVALLDRQIALQQQSIGLSRQQVTDAQRRMESMGVIFGLERQTLGLQQQTAANALKGQAASQGFEGALTESTRQLEQAAGAGVGVSNSLQSAASASQQLVGTISVGGQQIQLYSELPRPLITAAGAAESMAAGLATANSNASNLLTTLQAIARTPQARWAGGGVEAGQRYQVNELGQESLLHNGRLSLIRAGRAQMWTAPTSGTVLPAGLTAELASQGLIEGASNMRRSASGTMTAGQAARSGGSALGRQVARLAAATGRLEQRMTELVAKRWDVTVALPSNAGAMRLSQAFS
jgi:TP901 family phage tail tape measure protein